MKVSWLQRVHFKEAMIFQFRTRNQVSVNVLRRKHGGHMARAAAAAIFYGYLAAASIFSYLSVPDLRFHAGYARNAVIFLLLSSATLWSALSRKTCEYFDKQGHFDGGRFF